MPAKIAFEPGAQSPLVIPISKEDHKHQQSGTGHDDHDEDEDSEKHDEHEKHEGPEKHEDHEKHEAHEAHDKAANTHDEHGKAGHDEHEGEGKTITLTSRQMNEFAITTNKAAGRVCNAMFISFRPAEIKFNQDRIVHVIPRVDGTVKSVFVSEGQFIKKGTLMAVLDSRELADAKAEYLAAIARFGLAKENLEREKRLSRRKILAEKQYLDTRTKHVEAQIILRVATQKLRALGLRSSKNIRAAQRRSMMKPCLCFP